MISGTSKILSKSGPVDLLIITKNVSNNTRKFMESSWENIIYVNMGLKKSNMFEKMYVIGTIFFRFLFCLSVFVKGSVHILEIFLVEMRIEK
jgi:hypothetical protein